MTLSTFEKLKLHPAPVNKAAATVGFHKGEHFEVRFDSDRPKQKITLDYPPSSSPRPPQATDYTGLRRGRMTAYTWHRPSCSGKGTWWVCRCDCGLYEYRRPGTWASKPLPGDMCELCLRAKEMFRGPNSRQQMPERLAAWIQKMRALGLSDLEIALIRAPGMNVDTAGRSLDEVREQLARGARL